MAKPLFIHTDPQFLSRIEAESKGQAEITSSLLSALKSIGDPSIHISGVFLSPDNPSFSALNFIQLSLSHRPALQIFLIDPGKNLSQNQEIERTMRLAHVKGVFQGDESFDKMVQAIALKDAPDNLYCNRITPDAVADVPEQYMAIPVADLYWTTHHPYALFLPTMEGKMVMYAEVGSPVDKEYLRILNDKGASVYILREELAKEQAALTAFRSRMLKDQAVSLEWKSSEVLVNAGSAIDELKQNGVTDLSMQYAQAMLKDLYTLIGSASDDDDGDLDEVIARAKRCDRSIFCATHAMLMCRELGFERSSTLEILGFASVLQDISLYQTPFGDLSMRNVTDLTAEEIAFYQTHPNKSADSLHQKEGFPQVTLQVIRQQHERKDKTGFPNRIGGSQLHPMAEVLSMINSYYDATRATKTHNEAMIVMEKLAFPHYSVGTVDAFKKIAHAKL